MSGFPHKIAVTESLLEKKGQKAKQKMPPVSIRNKENSIQKSNFPPITDRNLHAYRTVLLLIKNLHTCLLMSVIVTVTLNIRSSMDYHAIRELQSG
jgi:hypothetical protein